MSSMEPLFLLELSKQSSGKTQEDIEYELEEQLLEEMRSRRLSDHESIQDHMIEMSPIITSESLKDIEQKYNEIPLLGSPILSSQTFSTDDDKKMNKESMKSFSLSSSSSHHKSMEIGKKYCASIQEIEQLNYNDCETYFPPIYHGKVVKVLDGDSIVIATKFNFSSQSFKFFIRLKGCEAPSIRSKKQVNKKAGQYVKRRLRDKLLGTIVRVDNMIKEKHGRFIADIYSCVDGTCINDWLRESNLCVEYNGGKKEKINWCDIIGSENFM